MCIRDRSSASEAKNENAVAAHQFANLALEKLESLLNGEGNPDGVKDFGALCQGQSPFPSSPGMKETLEEMLAAIFSRAGNSRGSSGMGGSGGGFGGDINSGFTTNSFSQLNVPVLGPERMRFERSPNSRAGKGGEGDSGRDGVSMAKAQESRRLEIENRETTRVESLQMELAPEKYREAIKRYFSEFD